MNAEGRPDASIDATGAVKIASGKLALTDAQKALALHYREAVITLVDRSLDQAGYMIQHAWPGRCSP